MKAEHFIVSTLDFFRVFYEKLFFPKFELLNSGCGLSASLYGKLFGKVKRNIQFIDLIQCNLPNLSQSLGNVFCKYKS